MTICSCCTTPSGHRKWLLAAVLFLMAILTTCKDGPPSNVLSEKEIVPVLKDLHIAYAGVDVTEKDPDAREKKYDEMNEVVMKKYNLSKETFLASYEYYQRNPAIMDSVYSLVIDALAVEMAPGGAKKNPPPPVKEPGK